jgi:ribonucleoside-diphosphate reductase alpha chain
MPTPKRPWSKDALDLINKRYLVTKSLSVNEWLYTVASYICQRYPVSQKQKKISEYTQLLKSRAFLPTSAALHNSLKGRGSLAGCIVLPLPDNSTDILQKSIPEMSEILFSGIGVGVNLSTLPPRLAEDIKTERASPGPVEMLKAITSATEAAMNYGGVKRSAFMASLDCQHLDLFEFISLKENTKMSNVNISISINEQFREALENKSLLPITYKDQTAKVKHLSELKDQAVARNLPDCDLSIKKGDELHSTKAGRKVGKVINNHLYFDPEVILETIAESAHRCGDPGLINLEAINESNPTHPKYSHSNHRGVGEITVTTPCGEQPLLPYEVCHLGSINLSHFASNKKFNWERFKYVATTAVSFMDDLIDAGNNVLDQANEMAQANRKIGIGLMGLADTLAELEYPYDSPPSIQFCQINWRNLTQINRRSQL